MGKGYIINKHTNQSNLHQLAQSSLIFYTMHLTNQYVIHSIKQMLLSTLRTVDTLRSNEQVTSEELLTYLTVSIKGVNKKLKDLNSKKLKDLNSMATDQGIQEHTQEHIKLVELQSTTQFLLNEVTKQLTSSVGYKITVAEAMVEVILNKLEDVKDKSNIK